MGWGAAQVVECLSTKLEALSSVLSAAKKKLNRTRWDGLSQLYSGPLLESLKGRVT
jgi:hypothetical protein